MEDMYKLSKMMKNLFPSTPEQDMQALKAMANAPVQEAKPTVNYLKESADVQEGSLQMDKNYSLSDFAALAGIVSEKQKDGDYAKGTDPMPDAKMGRETHPLKDKLVGEDGITTAIAHIDKELDAGDPMLASGALQRAVRGDVLSTIERRELKPYIELFQKLITDAGMRTRILAMAELLNNKPNNDSQDDDQDDEKKTDERKLTKKEIKKRDDYADELPDKDFKKRYGDDWEAIKYGTATNMAKKAKKESIKEQLYAQLNKLK